MAGKPQTIDGYLSALSDEQRKALEKLRKTIKATAPKAEECISYRLPAFRLDGRMLVAFGARANHCAFYLMSASTVAAYADELAGYETSPGTVRFRVDEPLPVRLVRKLVKARIAENAGSRSGTPTRPRARARTARPRLPKRERTAGRPARA
jgi:uncharacterized protein YdhG (YjbR/CyaY superfamily)